MLYIFILAWDNPAQFFKVFEIKSSPDSNKYRNFAKDIVYRYGDRDYIFFWTTSLSLEFLFSESLPTARISSIPYFVNCEASRSSTFGLATMLSFYFIDSLINPPKSVELNFIAQSQQNYTTTWYQ